MGLGLKPSPPGHSVLYSAADRNRRVIANLPSQVDQRTSLVRITGVAGGAQFTWVPPGPPQGAAAGRPGHAHADLQAAGDASVAAGVGVQEAVANPSV